MRLIDADKLMQMIPSVADDCVEEYNARMLIANAPTVDAIPIDWILNHEKMPKSGKGHDAIMDMIESWGERKKDAETD